MAVKLCGFVPSNATFRALVSLFEKDIDVEFVKVHMADGEHKTPEFLARNPFGQVPVLEDGDITIFESRAITQYVAHTYTDKGTDLMMKDPKKLAIQSVWMEVESQKFDLPSHKLTIELYFNVLRRGREADEALIAEFEKKLVDVLDVYEQRLMESKYLGGDSYTLVDLHHLPNLHYMMATRVKRLFEARPHVCAWAADILSRPAWMKIVSILTSEGYV
ncbi:glutathione S-transferase-like [Bidens hawaiensis]|uniref:glutathione S-transferase-like n=1 Tax=Bidens hawaiensis TaxID=980011 RepID=UPI00404A5C1D